MDKLGNITLYNADCMDIMRDMPDKAFDLAIIDPPYGVKSAKTCPDRLLKYGQAVTVNDYHITSKFITELFRVSKNQIIWGYNYLVNLLPPTSEFIFWYKHQPVRTYSDGELAYTSFNKTSRCFDYPYFGSHGSDEIRIHPTQKPVALYKWLLTHYAKPGDKILDTHLGSGSICIACHDLGFEMTGIELDKDYYEAAKKRIMDHQLQGKLF